ncbi:hypothetical protein [Microbacterium sp. p3-SID336]|uniref:DUF7882 family protein n=1 Tax=Microbacterium sp. p3-SID336 TaxID=2916212 RepID=UPI0021A6BF5B|nr:hypothetical protein [Microbacterium sp. p3-SID336]MCT1479309.1 hypothetical protein [Microbacterium sp. p3-SID336]
MGKLEYNSSRPPIDVEDELLAHLKILISTKLRRQESFMMTWPSGKKRPGRLSAWMHPSIPLVIEFDEEPPPQIDPVRMTHLMDRLNQRGELILDELD